jgi:hypothetical protein
VLRAQSDEEPPLDSELLAEEAVLEEDVVEVPLSAAAALDPPDEL